MIDHLHVGEMTGIGQIKHVFRISGRGLAIIVQDGFVGTIYSDGIVRSDVGASRFGCVEIADGRHPDGSPFGNVAVIATDPSAAESFVPGAKISFYRQSEASAPSK